MTTQNEIIEKLDLTADQTIKVKEAYEAVLVSDGEKDIQLYDGTITPNLNKRIAGMVQAVKSVNGKDGEVNITREDLKIPTDEQLARQQKEDRFVITEDGRTQRVLNRELIKVSEETKNYVESAVINAGAGVKQFAKESELKLFTPTLDDPKFAYAFDTSHAFQWVNGSWLDLGLDSNNKSKFYLNSIDIAKQNQINILEVIDVLLGKAIRTDSSGELLDFQNWGTSDLIPCRFGDIYQFNATVLRNVSIITAYDANRNFIKTLYSANVDLTDNVLRNIEISDLNISFIRFCYYRNSVTETFIKCVKTKISDSLVSQSIENSENLFKGYKSGAYLANDIEVVNASWNYSDYIEVDQLSSYVSNTSALYSASSTNTGLSVHFYDENKNFIGIGFRQQIGQSFSTPIGCRYIRINFFQDPNTVKVFRGDVYPERDILTTEIDAAAVVADLLYADGTVTNVPSRTNWKTTDFIDVSNAKLLTFKLRTANNVAYIVEYADDYSVVAVHQTDAESVTYLSGTITLDDTTKYIRTCYVHTAEHTITSDNFVNRSLVKKLNSALNVKGSHLNGQTWIALGDSITDHHTRPYTYSPIVAERLGVKLLDGAYSGRRIRNAFIRTTIVTDQAIRDADFITIAHGTNDFKLETSLGTINDTPTDPALFFNSSYTATSNKTDGTFYADYKGVIERIYSINPNIRIMLITPIRRTQPSGNNTDTNDKGHKLIDYVNAIKAVADLYALPYLDNYNTSGFSIATIPTWTTDGLHPTDWAHRNIMAVKIGNFIESN